MRAGGFSSDWGPLTSILAKILESKNPVYRINVLADNFKVLKHEKFNTSLVHKMFESNDPTGMFAIRKNELGGIVFSTVDEIGQVIGGGVDILGMNVGNMDQDK